MFEKYGTDYANPALQLNDLLPSVNQSEASNSILSTLFQRWLTKPNLANVAGTIGFARTPLAGLIQESTAYRQAYQLYPVFYREQGDQKKIADWNDILRKIAFTGVDPTVYDQWGTTTSFDFRPPINFDKFVNYSNYYWVNEVNTVEQPNYVTVTPNLTYRNDWSYSTTTSPMAGGWVHKNDISGRLAYAKQAQVPIIEFDDVEMCRWFKVVRTWKKYDVITNTYIETVEQPAWAAQTFVPPSSGFGDSVDTDWELQSETLIPIGAPPASGTALSQVYCIQDDIDNKPGRFTLYTSPTSGVKRSYLRGQNDIVVFAGNEYAQIVNFTEVEDLLTGQYGTQIDIPLETLNGVDITTLYAYVGVQSTYEANRGLTKKLVKLADGFTTFTPSGAPLGSTQYRSLCDYKLLGQRKLSKYQLPLFNLYSLTSAGAYEEQTTAGYILRYNQDNTQPVDAQLGQRVTTVATDLSFVLDLVANTGELLTYKRNDVAITADCDAHYTVWRGQPTASGVDIPNAHTPAYVDATRTSVAKTQPGGWQPSALLTSNPLRETRSQFKLSEVINHFQKLALNQPGTITISDDGGNYLVSSLLADGLSLPSLIDFVAGELTSYRSQYEQRIKTQMFTNQELRTTPTAQLASIIYSALRAADVTEGGANAVYDDTLSYDATTDLGYPKFPLTFGTLGLAMPDVVSVDVDRKLNHAVLTTHDSTAYSILISPREYASLEAALSTDIVVGTNPLPTSNYCIWQKSSIESYRFECYYFSTTAPTSPVLNATWFNPDTLVASVWTGSTWLGISVDVLWTPFDVAEVLLSVFAQQEQDLLALIASRPSTTLPTDLDLHSVASFDTTPYGLKIKQNFADFSFAYQQRDLADQAMSRLLAPPSAVDPFTWNYGTHFPQTPSVYRLYLTMFGTPVPHKQPWKMQDHLQKPSWWDAEYADLSGQRKWSTQMWSNIATGTVPFGRPLANGTIGTGIAGQFFKVYTVIPVNCTSTTYYGYAPDDLLPPYINTLDDTFGLVHPLLPYVLIPAQPAAAIPAPQNPAATLGQYLVFPSGYASGNFIDNIWKIASTKISRQLHAAYSIDPMHFVTTILTNHHKSVGGLKVNPATNNVSRNTDSLHGEKGMVDHTLFAALTFLSRSSNFATHGTSPLATWKSWSTRLAYQTNSLIVPQTLKIYQDCYNLTEYDIILKKSENIRRIPFSNVIITLAAVGDPSLSTGRGENWTFKVACSESNATTRHYYAKLQQEFVWNNISKNFTINSTDAFRWVDGEAIQLVNPPASITSNLFYISTVSGAIRLYTSNVDSVMGVNPIDFDSVFTGPIEFRTVKATFTAGNQVWETVEVDRRSPIQFSFADNILITGVQNLIDFIVGYTEYMQDDGIVINAGSTPALDPDTNAVISWQQQITKAVDKIFASNGLSTNGYQPIFVPGADGKLRPITMDRMYVDTPFVEINPFRGAVYFNTPDGVICDFNRTPYVNEPTSQAAIYDDTATPILSTELIPLRTDRLTSVVFNDQQPARPINISQDVSRRIAFGEISLDFYEHAIVFDQQTSNGLMIFDRFFNLQKASLNLEFQKSIDFYYRPVMGGFAVTDSGTLPNFETVADYQRNDYDVAESNELVQSTIDSRQMLGKLPLSYFQNIPVTSKTEFQFWQQMIREKGTKGAIDAFTRHQLYDDVKYDEFWAWKLGTFGATVPRKQIEMALQVGDALHTANSFYFSAGSLPQSAFVVQPILPLDQTRWIDFPEYLDQVGQNGVTFAETQVSTIVSGAGTGYLYFICPGDTLSTVEYLDTTVAPAVWAPVPTADYVAIGNRIVRIAGNAYSQLKLTGLLPAYGQVSPVRVIDTDSKVVVKTMPAWDPANGIHTNAIVYFDHTATDPASYNRTQYQPTGSPWGVQQLGQYWIAGESLVYKPYFDTTAFPSLDDRNRYWGELADGYTPTAYQWVESSTAPTVRSTDAPFTRVLMRDRTNSKAVIASNSNSTTFVCSSPLPAQCVNNAPVVLYKNATALSNEMNDFTGIEYAIVDIDATRTSFSLMANGVTLTVPTGVSVDGLFITSTWADAVIAEVQSLSCTLYAHANPVSNTFQLPWSNVAGDTTLTATGELVIFVPHDLTSSTAVVNVDGIAAAFSITETGLLSIYDAYGQPVDFTTRQSSVITVHYPVSTVAATGQPTLATPDLTYVDIEVPHVEYTQVINQLSVTKYYYWSATPAASSAIKPVPLATAIDALIRPQTGNYMAIHANRQLMTIWGLYGTHQLASKALAIDLDVTMRDKYVAPSVSKTTNEQWVLFREYQDGYPNQHIWDAVAATVIGTRTINATSTVIIPSPDRVSYDYLYDTTLSYGTGPTQALIPPVRARELFFEFFSTANPLVDSTWHALLSSSTWTTMVASKQYTEALAYVYLYLPSTLLNSFIFVILREGLYSGYHYDGIFKTSFVALQTSQKVVVG